MTTDFFYVGQEVLVPANTAVAYYYHTSEDAVGVITRVGTYKVLVRGNILHGEENSHWLEMDALRPLDPDAPKPAKARKLGEAPDGAIAIDDPRIDWIWQDVAKYATQQGYCGTFDSIAASLGIPGRERNFKLKATVGPLTGTFTIKARSKKEAEAILAKQLTGATTVSTEEE